MADIQIDNGNFTRIANELLEAICRTKLSNYEHRVFMMIVRKTYGFNKKEDWISLKQLSELTGISISSICKTIKKLKAKNMIIRNDKITGIQKDYNQWKLSKQTVSKQTVSKQIIKVVQTDNKTLSKQTDTKEKKETIQKKEITLIFDYWNKKEIIIHKKLDQVTSSSINAKLKDYSIDEIKDAIYTYSVILKDDSFRWSYYWTLKEFIQKGFDKFKDKDIAYKNYSREDKK